MSVVQRRNDELVEILRPDFVTNDGLATPSFAWTCVGDGAAATPSYHFCLDTDTGFYRPAANEIGIATLGTRRGIWNASGALILNDAAASTFMTGPGITIQQGGLDNEAAAAQSTDVAHGMTTLADTDTYYRLLKAEGAAGGVALDGFKDADGIAGAAAQLRGYLGENADTDKTTASRAIVEIIGYVKSGTTIGNTNADGNVFGVRTHRGGVDVTLLLVDEDGDLHVFNDIALTNDLLLLDGAVIGITGNEIITFQAAGTIDFTGADVTMDNDLTVTNDILLSNGSFIGITGNEIITFQAAGTIDFTGADVTMDNDLTVTNDILLSDGSVIGITGNERIQFNAAGTIQILGADVLMGTEDGGGKLNFDEGTTIADGIVWGSDANKVTLYRSADDMLKTDDSLTVVLGLNAGTPDVAAGTGSLAISDHGNLYKKAADNFGRGWNVYKRGDAGGDTNAIVNTAELGFNSFYGWDGAAYGRGGYLIFEATENWNGASHGTEFGLWTTPDGSVINVKRLEIAQDGLVTIYQDLIVGGSHRASISIGVRAYRDAAFVHNNTGNWLPIDFNQQRWDDPDNNQWAIGTPTRLTCQFDGIYVITGSVRWATSAVGRRALAVFLNATTYIVVQTEAGLDAENIDQSVTTTYKLNAADFVELLGYQSSGGNLNILSSGNFSPEFSMVRVA